MEQLGPRERKLHAACLANNPQAIKEILRECKSTEINVNAQDDNGDVFLHVLTRHITSSKLKPKERKATFDCLWKFLVYCDADSFDINIVSNRDGNTALHIALLAKNIECLRILLVFGADVNKCNSEGNTPSDVARHHLRDEELIQFLQTKGGYAGAYGQQGSFDSVDSFSQLIGLSANNEPPESMPVKLVEGGLKKLQIGSQVKIPATFSPHTGLTPLEFGVQDGQRILCLDGGGLKGLILIEVLIYIERQAGRKITELFDWIVGTSTGGIIALALVYAKKSLHQLKQLYFELKEDVFSSGNRYGYGFDTKKKEQVLLRYFDPEMKMTDITEPKVLITAVDCQNSNLEVVFFNNCFFDKHSEECVWKVAKYTSAAPVYFEPEDCGQHRYIDGGIKANNPTDYALTKIQTHLDEQSAAMQLPPPQYGCVVSVGCGVYPPDPIGDFNIQKFMSMSWEAIRIHKFFPVLENLLKLFGNALSNEEEVADNCRLRCEKQKIPFYRFNPVFDAESDVKILPTETDVNKLSDLVLRAQEHIRAWEHQIDLLLNLVYKIDQKRRQAFGFKLKCDDV